MRHQTDGYKHMISHKHFLAFEDETKHDDKLNKEFVLLGVHKRHYNKLLSINNMIPNQLPEKDGWKTIGWQEEWKEWKVVHLKLRLKSNI